jgi:hypothetical protein
MRQLIHMQYPSDPLIHSLFVLGKLPSSSDPSLYLPALISLQKTHFSTDAASTLVQQLVEEVKPIEGNDIVFTISPAMCIVSDTYLRSIIGFLAGWPVGLSFQTLRSTLSSPQPMFMFARHGLHLPHL